jgi:hypothetical protein
VELAELVSDPDFRQRIRQLAVYRMQGQAGDKLPDWNRAGENSAAAVLRGVAPDSAEAAQMVDRILEPAGASGRQAELLARLEVLSDPRIERYWQLTATINGWPPFPSRTPALEWLIAALRAHE